MKVLHTVEFYEPFQGGAQEVVRQLSERMVKAGHDVTVATTKLPERKHNVINGVKIREFTVSGNAVRGYEGDVDGYKKYLLGAKFDVVMNYAAQQWATDLCFEELDNLNSKKVFVPCGFSGLYEPAYKNYFDEMPSTLRKYDASVYLSSNYRDINFARKNKIKGIHIIPNGAAEDEFLSVAKNDIRQKLGIPSSSFLIVTVGTHTGVKGHAEAIEIFSKSKLKNATFVVIGNKLAEGCGKSCLMAGRRFNRNIANKIRNSRLIIKDLPRKQTVQLLQAADLFLFPSNIEASPIVLFEACASKTPFLATDVGNSKEIAEWTGGGEILPTDKDKQGYSHVDVAASVAVLRNLYDDELKRQKLARIGFATWRDKYSWEKITQQYIDLYQGLLNK